MTAPMCQNSLPNMENEECEKIIHPIMPKPIRDYLYKVTKNMKLNCCNKQKKQKFAFTINQLKEIYKLMIQNKYLLSDDDDFCAICAADALDVAIVQQADKELEALRKFRNFILNSKTERYQCCMEHRPFSKEVKNDGCYHSGSYYFSTPTAPPLSQISSQTELVNSQIDPIESLIRKYNEMYERLTNNIQNNQPNDTTGVDENGERNNVTVEQTDPIYEYEINNFRPANIYEYIQQYTFYRPGAQNIPSGQYNISGRGDFVQYGNSKQGCSNQQYEPIRQFQYADYCEPFSNQETEYYGNSVQNGNSLAQEYDSMVDLGAGGECSNFGPSSDSQSDFYQNTFEPHRNSQSEFYQNLFGPPNNFQPEFHQNTFEPHRNSQSELYQNLFGPPNNFQSEFHQNTFEPRRNSQFEFYQNLFGPPNNFQSEFHQNTFEPRRNSQSEFYQNLFEPSNNFQSEFYQNTFGPRRNSQSEFYYNIFGSTKDSQSEFDQNTFGSSRNSQPEFYQNTFGSCNGFQSGLYQKFTQLKYVFSKTVGTEVLQYLNKLKTILKPEQLAGLDTAYRRRGATWGPYNPNGPPTANYGTQYEDYMRTNTVVTNDNQPLNETRSYKTNIEENEVEELKFVIDIENIPRNVLWEGDSHFSTAISEIKDTNDLLQQNEDINEDINEDTNEDINKDINEDTESHGNVSDNEVTSEDSNVSSSTDDFDPFRPLKKYTIVTNFNEEYTRIIFLSNEAGNILDNYQGYENNFIYSHNLDPYYGDWSDFIESDDDEMATYDTVANTNDNLQISEEFVDLPDISGLVEHLSIDSESDPDQIAIPREYRQKRRY